MTQPFTLSIEVTSGQAIQHGFHLGTDERLARQIAVEKFTTRVAAGMPTVTVALMRNRRIVDVYDGQWQSERDCVAPYVAEGLGEW